MFPDQVGPYLIERKLGSGGMGTVYLGKHEETGQLAAVKVLPASLAREPGFVVRFNREVEAMQSLTNPHVVEVFESGTDDETYYYAMEYVKGLPLSKHIRDHGRMPWQDVIKYGVQICSALKAAHDAGIIHRDLKPSNLIVTDDGLIKLLDFGVAQVFASGKLTKTGGIIGTAEYMSPEQAQGRRATKKSDLYSLGAVMYVMVTGRPPYSGKTTMEVIQKHKFGQFDRPRSYAPDMPFWLDDVICKCMEKDPDDRYPDAYVLSLRLNEILKKVELSQQAGVTESTGTIDGTAETIVAGSDPNAVGGTLMRDLLRSEIDRKEDQHPIQKLLDNVWVLLLLLVLIIGGGVYWFQSLALTPEQRFARGMELYEQGPGFWREARQEYFEPLLEEDAETWSEEIDPMLVTMDIEELKQDFGLTKLKSRRLQRMSDASRFVHLAKEYYQAGNIAQAEQTLRNLSALLMGQSEYATLQTAVQEILTEIERKSAVAGNAVNSETQHLAAKAVNQAKTFLAANDTKSARKILISLISLYDGESAARSEVEWARTTLATLEK